MTSLRTVAETLSKSLSDCVTLASHCYHEERRSKVAHLGQDTKEKDVKILLCLHTMS